MKILFCAVLFLTLTFQNREFSTGTIGTVQFIEDGQGTSPVITVFSNVKDADQVIVRTFYRTDVMVVGRSTQLLLSGTSVIPCIPGSAVAVDSVPVKQDRIAWVELTLVKNIVQEKAQVNQLKGE